MRRSYRLWSTLTATVAFIGILGAGPVGAHVQQVDVNDPAQLLASGRVRVSGTITCTAGETWELHVRGKQPGNQDPTTYRGEGNTAGSCTGAPVRWRVTLRTIEGTPVPGDLQVLWFASTNDGDRQHDGEVVTLV
jgi:hypothetical protein